MPHMSTAAKLALARRLLGTSRYVDALLVIERPDGSEVCRVGGLWDCITRSYSTARPPVPVVCRLKASQVEPDPVTGLSIADGLARWLDKMRRSDDTDRPIVIMGAGNRGSGKSYLLGSLWALVVALEWPRGAQFSVNLSGKQKREIIAGIDKIAPDVWTLQEVKDPRDPFREFVTSHRLYWRTGKAPDALREGGIDFQYGFVNEGQDQSNDVAVNAVGAIRNIGGLVGIATNPDPDGGWVGEMVERIEAGPSETRGYFGERYIMRAALNDAISQASQPKIEAALYAIDDDQADADARGLWRRRGQAYPSFTSRPRRVDERGKWIDGHVGSPPLVEVGRVVWRDVTREETARAFGGEGHDWIAGSDFQRHPGCCAAVGKLYRDEADELILYVREFVGAPGDERAFAQALEDRGYVPGDVDFDGHPVVGRSLVIVGDGTGDIQDASHRRGTPYSFVQLARYGWSVKPPMRHRSGAPCNPLIPDSLKQVDTLLRAGAVVFDPACNEAAAEFATLIDGFKKSTINSSGKFVKKGHFTHGPDGVRYMAWRFMPRNKPLPLPRNTTLLDDLRSIRTSEQ